MSRVVLSREQFLNRIIPRTVEDVPVPEFGEGCVVPVGSLMTDERNAYEAAFQGKDGKMDRAKQLQARQRLVVACCRNDDGTPMFTIADLASIAKQNGAVVERLVEAALRITGMKTDVEALEKKCEETDDSV